MHQTTAQKNHLAKAYQTLTPKATVK